MAGRHRSGRTGRWHCPHRGGEGGSAVEDTGYAEVILTVRIRAPFTRLGPDLAADAADRVAGEAARGARNADEGDIEVDIIGRTQPALVYPS